MIEITGLKRGTHDGVLVVIDVFRAFTTAAQAFSSGAAEIRCVEATDEALAMKKSDPAAVLIGEERGLAPEGFEFGNSPIALERLDLADKTVIHRTSNGTRGLAWINAPLVLAASAANATATARWIRNHHPDRPVRLVSTHDAGEDEVCAHFIASTLRGERPSAAEMTRQISECATSAVARWEQRRGDDGLASFRADLARCAEADWFNHAMVGSLEGSVIALRAAAAT